jgi:hypothetical protein
METGNASVVGVPNPPRRDQFKTAEAYLEARDSYRHRIGRVLPRKKKKE